MLDSENTLDMVKVGLVSLVSGAVIVFILLNIVTWLVIISEPLYELVSNGLR